MWWPYLVGYAFSLAGSLTFVKWSSDAMWKPLGWSGRMTGDASRPFTWHTRAIGALEAAMYTSAWVLHQPTLIAGWLVLKVAGKWSRWGQETSRQQGKPEGRAVYNVFLMGTGLNLCCGIIGGQAVLWLLDRHWPAALAAGLAWIVAGVALLVTAKHYQRAGEAT